MLFPHPERWHFRSHPEAAPVHLVASMQAAGLSLMRKSIALGVTSPSPAQWGMAGSSILVQRCVGFQCSNPWALPALHDEATSQGLCLHNSHSCGHAPGAASSPPTTFTQVSSHARLRHQGGGHRAVLARGLDPGPGKHLSCPCRA